MAGRGTDILLGGNPEFMARQQALAEQIAERLPKGEERFVDDEEFVYFYHLDGFYRVPKAATTSASSSTSRSSATPSTTKSSALGGLHIVGTERHEARRIDNQLRGRAGRQGDPGLVALLPVAAGRPDAHLRVGSHLRPDAAARHGRRRADRARDGDQGHRARAEAGRGAELLRPQAPARVRRRDEQAAREHLRAAPPDSRRPIKFEDEDGEEEIVDTREYLMTLAEDILDALVETYAPREADLEAVGPRRARSARSTTRSRSTPTRSTSATGRRTRSATCSGSAISESYEEKEALVGREILQRVERDIMLQIVDEQWKDHLYSLDHLKEGIGLRGYGQRDPLVEYKKESFELFQEMKERIDEEIVQLPLAAPSGHRRRGDAAPRAAPRARAPRPPLILSNPARRAGVGIRRRARVGRRDAGRSRRRQAGSRRASAATMPP